MGRRGGELAVDWLSFCGGLAMDWQWIGGWAAVGRWFGPLLRSNIRPYIYINISVSIYIC